MKTDIYKIQNSIEKVLNDKPTLFLDQNEFNKVKSKRVDFISDTAMIFISGIDEKKPSKEYEVMLRPGARVFIYTDGLTEASDPDNKMFGTERMLDSLNRRTDASLMEVLQGIQNDVDAFARGAVQFDDLTMLCLEYKGME